MDRLKEIQGSFLKSMKTPQEDTFSSYLKTTKNFTPQKSTRVYQANYKGTLSKALKNSYPITRKILGEDVFESIAMKFIHDNPSYEASLKDYGANFSSTVTSVDIPFLQDIMQLEWLNHQLYYSPGHQVLNGEEIDASKTKIQLAPSLTFLETRHPLLELWDFYEEETPLPEKLEEAQRLIILWRHHNTISMLETDPSLLGYLEIFKAQPKTIEEVIESFETEEQAISFGFFLKQALEHNWLVS